MQHRVIISFKRPGGNGVQPLPNERSTRSARIAWLILWAREPLLHFLLIGLLLFGVYLARGSERRQASSPNGIELSADDLRELQVSFATKWHRAPNTDELAALVNIKMKETMLDREARALGFEKQGAREMRRSGQDIEFFTNDDTAKIADPSQNELRRWFAKQANRFALQPRVTFRHLYFSSHLRGHSARDAAALTLTRLTGNPLGSPGWEPRADRFMFQGYYADRSPQQIATVFGLGFAKSLLQLKPGSWQGPLESGYGWHLVEVQSITPGRVPSFEEVEKDVRAEWIADQHAEIRRKSFETILAKHDLLLPNVSAPSAASFQSDRSEVSR